MAKLYTVSVRWVKTPMNLQSMDNALRPVGDWIRFNGYLWLVWTDQRPDQITAAVRSVATSAEDSVLVIASDPADFGGWAAPWVWEWIRSKAQIGLESLGGIYGIPPRR